MGDGYDYLVLITLDDGSKRPGKVSSILINAPGGLAWLFGGGSKLHAYLWTYTANQIG